MAGGSAAVAKAPPNHHDKGNKEDQTNQQRVCCCCCWCCCWSSLIAGKVNQQQIPPDQRKRWPGLWGQSPLYSRPPWHHGRRLRVPFAEWMFYEPLTSSLTLDNLIAEVKGIYAGHVMVESKCIEVDAAEASRQQVHDIDAIPFLDAIPSSVLIQIQRGNVDPEQVVRNAVRSSREKIKDIIKEQNKGATDVAFYHIPFHISTAFAIDFTGLDLHVPTIEESLHGFMIVQESRAKESGSPHYQALANLTTKTIGDEGRARVAARQNVLTIGRDLSQAVEEAMEQAKRNIAQWAEEEKAEKAEDKAEQEARLEAKEDARQYTIHKVCGCCGAPICAHQAIVKPKKNEDDWKPLPLPEDSRPLEDASRYKKVGEIYYVSAHGRWMNISLKDNQYRALGALHDTSMQGMYDFFMASSHPQASAALMCLSAKYAMPARLWRHSIHAFLEILRFRLPESSEHINSAILRAYSMMRLLEETTRFGDFTVEATGDLARYRFAMEKDVKVRLHWKGVAIQQYNRVVDFDATIGRLHHHLSILSSGNYTASLFNILKALTVSRPFSSAWNTMNSTILAKFVAPEGQTSIALEETLSLDEDNLYTAIVRLLLASAPSADLQNGHFDTCKETHLLAFDRLLWFVAGLDDPKSTLPSKLLALLQMSPRPKTPDDTIHLTPSLVGPASHYMDSTCYIRGKTIIGPASHATRAKQTKKANSRPSLSTGVVGWVTKRFFQCSPRPAELIQSYTVRPSPELGLLLCQLLFLNKDLAVADRAAQLLSVVNNRILATPVTNDLKLWQYLNVLLVVMRSLNTRPNLIKRFGFAFHPELIAPLLNVLLRRLEDRGGDAWEALFQPEFPILWVPLNTRNKPGKYGMTTTDAQREYFLHKWKHEVESSMVDDTETEATGAKQEKETGGTKADNVTMMTTEDSTEIAAEAGNGTFEMVAPNAENNTQVAAEVSIDKLRNDLETGNIKCDNSIFDMVEIGGVEGDGIRSETDSVQPVLQSKAKLAEHGPEDKLAAAQGATAHVVESESNISSEGPIVERLYTVVLPEDRLLRGFSFAKEAPSLPKLEQPPSEKQIAREKFEEREIRIAKLKNDKANRQAQRHDRKQQRRIARGLDYQPQKQKCAQCWFLAKSREVKIYKKALIHNSKACKAGCQEYCERRQVDTPEITENIERSPDIKPNSVVEAAEKESENGGTATPAGVTEDNTTPANKPTANVSREAIKSTELISDDAHPPQESEYPDVHANEPATEELPNLALLFQVADEVAKTVDENASQPARITKPDNSDVSTTCEKAEKIDAQENSSPSTVTELETDYGISSMFAQADAEADSAELKAQEAREKAQEEEEALRLDPYFYPPGFFENSKLDWEDFLACDYVQDIDVTDGRELRILWTAISTKCFFNFQADKNGNCIIDILGGKSVPQPYFDAQMPALNTRDDGTRVVYVDPTVAEIVAESDGFWKRAEESDRKRREHEEGNCEKGRKEGEEEGKEQQVTETKDSKDAQTPKDAQDKAMVEIKETQVERPPSLQSSTHSCSSAALRSSRAPCTTAQEGKAVQGIEADQGVKKDAREVKSAREKFEETQSELEPTEEVRPMQEIEALDEWCSIVGEPPLETAEEAGDTTNTHDAGEADEQSDRVADLPESSGGVAQLTHAAVAAIPMRDEEDVEFPAKEKRPSKSTGKWVEAQGADESGKKGGIIQDDENSDGWTEFILKTDNLFDVSEGVGGHRKKAPKSVISRFLWD